MLEQLDLRIAPATILVTNLDDAGLAASSVMSRFRCAMAKGVRNFSPDGQ
jgi:hypothetical protein